MRGRCFPSPFSTYSSWKNEPCASAAHHSRIDPVNRVTGELALRVRGGHSWYLLPCLRCNTQSEGKSPPPLALPPPLVARELSLLFTSCNTQGSRPCTLPVRHSRVDIAEKMWVKVVHGRSGPIPHLSQDVSRERIPPTPFYLWQVGELVLRS